MANTEALATGRSDARGPVAAGPGRTMPALAAAGLVVSMQQTLVLPLLPRLMQTFHASVSAVTWVFTVTLLAGAVATPLLSRFGDMYGKKRMMIVTMGLLIAGSTVCALSDSLGVLIVGRALQGTSAALIPLAIGTIRDNFPRERITTAIGVVSATMGFGGSVGMLVTGVIAAHTASHHPIFWIAAATGVIGLILVMLCTSGTGERAGGRPDIPGAIVLGAWLVCLLLAISKGNDWGWTSERIIGLVAAAAGLCALWTVIELRSRDPLVRLNLLVGHKSLSANVAGLLLGFALFAGFTLIANFVETPRARLGYGLSGSVLDVGLYMLPSAVTMLVFSALAGRLETRIGAAYTLAIGAIFVALSYAWLAVSHSSGPDFLVFSATQGLGVGIGYAALGTLAVQHVPMDQSGIASGINTLVRTTGGSIASAATAAVLSAYVITNTTLPSLHGYVVCFFIGAASAGLTAAVAAWHGLRHAR
jgi:MFS family permease